MALDHSRLGLENKSDRIFGVRQNLGARKLTFYTFYTSQLR